MMAGPGCAMTSTATAARPAGASGSNGDDTLPVRRSALVVAVPGDGQARKQAVFAAREDTLPEPRAWRLQAGLRESAARVRGSDPRSEPAAGPEAAPLVSLPVELAGLIRRALAHAPGIVRDGFPLASEGSSTHAPRRSVLRLQKAACHGRVLRIALFPTLASHSSSWRRVRSPLGRPAHHRSLRYTQSPRHRTRVR
jgi:hypothetical protein